MKIGNYEILKQDDMQFRLEKNGKLVGYYGYLDQLLNKILNSEALDLIDDAKHGTQLMDGLLALYGSITSAYGHIKPRDIK